MANQYTINVNNNSDRPQSYCILSEKPEVQPNPSGQILPNVLASVNSGPGMTVCFTIKRQYCAIVGEAGQALSHGSTIRIKDCKDVTLGSSNSQGNLSPGTSLEVDGSGGGLRFAHTNLPNGGGVNGFEIKRSALQADSGKAVIGLGGFVGGSTSPVPVAVFTPDPNVDYQIKPGNTYWLIPGRYNPGQLVESHYLQGALKIDFGASAPSASVVHEPSGRLVRR